MYILSYVVRNCFVLAENRSSTEQSFENLRLSSFLGGPIQAPILALPMRKADLCQDIDDMGKFIFMYFADYGKTSNLVRLLI